jgi:TPR repeat protein
LGEEAIIMLNLRRIAIGLVLALLVTLPATAQDFGKGLSAATRGDYATALREWRPLAEQGDAKAQHNLGVMYSKGRGVPQDYAEALKWYRMAANQGRARAQYSLGQIFRTGLGVPKDYAEAVIWYRKAAEQGNVKSQGALGVMYSNGQGVPQDYVLAYMWTSLAAATGDKTATKNLDMVARETTPAQIAEAQKLAREWRAKHPKKK